MIHANGSRYQGVRLALGRRGMVSSPHYLAGSGARKRSDLSPR